MIRVYFKTNAEPVEVSGESAEFTKPTQVGETPVLRITAHYKTQAEFPAEVVLGWVLFHPEPDEGELS